MGNCIAMQAKVIKVMKTDGKVLQYKAPLRCHSSQTVGKKKVRFSDDQVEGDEKPAQHGGGGDGVVRIKMIITKQELMEMLKKGGVSFDGVIYKLEEKQSTTDTSKFEEDDCRGWKPLLESIPELD